MRIVVHYTDLTKETINSGYTTSGYNPNTIGTQTVTVWYQEKCAYYNVNVKEKPVSKTLTYISIQTKPTKTVYYKGEALDTSGMRLTLHYNDSTSEIISSGYTTSGYNPNTAGTQTVTVWYNNFKTTFSVNVLTPEIRLSQNDVSIKSGEIITLTAVTVPDGRTVTWVSSDTNILNVNAGKITAISVGNAVVTAKFVYNGAVYSDLCKVAVERNILLGDINEDGKINSLDLAQLKMKLISDYAEYESDAQYDINTDGEINILDLIRLKKLVAENS